MSFILDALKKSESDRQQKSTPDISDVATAVNPAGTPRALWLLIGLLALTVVVLLAVLLRPTPAGAPPPIAAEPAPAETRLTRPAAVPATAENPPARTDSGPVTTADPPAPAQAPPVTVARQADQTATPPANRSAEPASAAPPVVAPAAPAERTETYLTFNDLRATGSIDLPDLHIDLHVYSDNSAERFVFINMNQYRENATLSEGPLLRQITTEGVVLEFLGTTFLLPRE